MPRQTRQTAKQPTLAFANTKTAKAARAVAAVPAPGRATRNRPNGATATGPPPLVAAKRRRCTVCKRYMKGHGKACKGLSKSAALDRANDRSHAFKAQLEDAFEKLKLLRVQDEDEDAVEEDAAGADMTLDSAPVSPVPMTSVQVTPMAVDDVPAVAPTDAPASDQCVEEKGDSVEEEDPYYLTHEIAHGLKSTPSGDTELTLVRNGKGKRRYPTQKLRTKSTPRLFQSVVQKADELVRRVDGWSFAFFIPKEGRGEMRSWASHTVMQDAPTLPSSLRASIFDALEPARKQVLEERAKLHATREKQLMQLQKRTSLAEEELARVRAELDDVRGRVDGA